MNPPPGMGGSFGGGSGDIYGGSTGSGMSNMPPSSSFSGTGSGSYQGGSYGYGGYGYMPHGYSYGSSNSVLFFKSFFIFLFGSYFRNLRTCDFYRRILIFIILFIFY